MTSARPKLRPESLTALTGWDTVTGRPIWMGADGRWSSDVRCLQVLCGAEADQALATALAQQEIVTDPYLVEVTEEGCLTGREILRERLRAGLAGLSHPVRLQGGQIA